MSHGARPSVLASAAPWLGLALAGQAMALGLIDAGNLLGYQHYPPLPVLVRDPAKLLLLVGLAAQGLLVAFGLRRAWPRLRDGARLLPLWAWGVLAAMFVVTSSTLSEEVSRYLGELMLASIVQSIQLGNILLLAMAPSDASLAPPSRLRTFLEPAGDGGGSLDAPALIGAAWVAGVGAVLAVASYGRHPHVPDEVAYFYHARYFAEGLLSMPLPPVPEAFNVDLMHYEAERWYSPFPPGWPAVLAVGMKLGAGWLVNPLLNGVNVLLGYLLLARLYDRPTARLGLILLCTSPWFLFMGMNLMAHTSTLTCTLFAGLALVQMQRSGHLSWGWLAGLATGAVSLIRPLDGFALACVLGVCALGIRGRRFRFAPVAVLAAGTVLVGGLNLPYNAHITGDPSYHPVMAYFDHYYGPGVNDMGFGPDRGVGWGGIDPFPGHDLLDALINGNMNLFAVNVELFGWSMGSLLLATFFVLSGNLRRLDGLFAASIAWVIGLHSFYWFSGGPDFGARYWYLIFVPCLVLSARGIQRLGEALERSGAAAGGQRVRLAVLALCGLATLSFVPWRAIDKYPGFRGMTPGVRRLAADAGWGRTLVLIRGPRRPDYASAIVYNPVDLDADEPLFVWDRGPEVRARLAAAFPDRPVWIVDGPSRTGRDFEIVSGPIAPEDFAREVREGAESGVQRAADG